MNEELTEIQLHILLIIENDTKRASAITSILSSHHLTCNQNQVIQALNDLKKRRFAVRSTSKGWSARRRANEPPR
ncbi:MAG: hypothetical protein JW779_04715 [Candidatus Thorarchaeota archaeon]|nr:hypothetical protein [Candidatus Thorarchaeota archaeon]